MPLPPVFAPATPPLGLPAPAPKTIKGTINLQPRRRICVGRRLDCSESASGEREKTKTIKTHSVSLGHSASLENTVLRDSLRKRFTLGARSTILNVEGKVPSQRNEVATCTDSASPRA